VASEKGAWLSTSRTGQTISALVSADLRADLAEGACFNDNAGGGKPALDGEATESSRRSRSVPLDAMPSILVCITIADVRKGCGWPTFCSVVRTIESDPSGRFHPHQQQPRQASTAELGLLYDKVGGFGHLSTPNPHATVPGVVARARPHQGPAWKQNRRRPACRPAPRPSACPNASICPAGQ